jgi:hypothetical protein
MIIALVMKGITQMIEVLKQALEALKDVGVLTDREWQAVHKNKANELRQAIKELESQEPVGFTSSSVTHPDGNCSTIVHSSMPIPEDTLLFTHPPQRTVLQPKEIARPESAKVRDYNRGWNDCLFASGIVKQSQHTWVGLAKEDRLCAKYMQDAPEGIEAVIDYIESKLKELNT